MKITPDIIRHEFIGCRGEIAQSIHRDYVGITGTIISETRNTFILKDEDETKNIIKDTSIFNFQLNDGTIVQIDGKLLVGRPEDRLKKTMKRLW